MTNTGIGVCVVPGRCRAMVRYVALFVVLMWPAVSAAQILNAGFEQYRDLSTSPDTAPSYWSLGSTDWATQFGSEVTSVWQTEGEHSAGLFSRFGRSFSAGDRQTLWQRIDLTEVGAIAFDVRLAAYGSAEFPWFDNFAAVVLVNGVPLWSATEDGTYLDQYVNVSNFSGLCKVELCIQALVGGQFDVANWVQWDNLRTAAAPTEMVVDAFVDVCPRTLCAKSMGQWVACFISLPEGYDVKDIDGATVTLEGIPAYVGRWPWARAEATSFNVMDLDHDGVYERMVMFDRDEILEVLSPGENTVTITGRLDETTTFEGTAQVRVIGSYKGKGYPKFGGPGKGKKW